MSTSRKSPPSRSQILQAMGSLCAKSEQCEQDLREKMRRRGVGSADAEYVIEYLKEHNFLNETRYARAYTLDKLRFNHWGRIKLRLMLASKHLDADTIKYALNEIEEQEYLDILRQVINIKAKKYDIKDPSERQKLIRSVYSRGFEPPLINQVIGEGLQGV